MSLTMVPGPAPSAASGTKATRSTCEQSKGPVCAVGAGGFPARDRVQGAGGLAQGRSLDPGAAITLVDDGRAHPQVRVQGRDHRHVVPQGDEGAEARFDGESRRRDRAFARQLLGRLRLRDTKHVRAARAPVHGSRTDPGAPAVEGHRRAETARTLAGEGEPGRLAPFAVVPMGEEDNRAGPGGEAGRPDQHGRADTGQARTEEVAATAVGERQDRDGRRAGGREVGVEGVDRAAIVAGPGRSDDQEVAGQGEGRAETVDGGEDGGGEKRGGPAGRGEPKHRAGACVGRRPEVDGVASERDGAARTPDFPVSRRRELDRLRPRAIVTPLEDVGPADPIATPRRAHQQSIPLHRQRGPESVPDRHIVTRDDVRELPAVIPPLEHVDTPRRGVDLTHPSTSPPHEDLPITDRDRGPETRGPPHGLVIRRVSLTTQGHRWREEPGCTPNRDKKYARGGR